MKATEFVKENGIEAAKDFLDLPSYSIDQLLMLQSGLNCKDLKRLVESHELINRFRGIDKAKRELKLIEEGSILRCCTAITAEMLRQGIADVEACQ